MTSTPPPNDLKGLSHTIFRGRRPGPLLGPWLGAAIVAAIVYGFETKMPAFHDVVGPLYWILLGIALVATWRWMRIRSRDRRAADRRHGGREGGGTI